MSETKDVRLVEKAKTQAAKSGESVGFSPSNANPQNGQPKVRYTRPAPVDDSFSEEDCTAAINQIREDVRLDAGHPLMNKLSPLHKDFKAHHTRLHEVRAKARDGKPTQFDVWEEERQEKQQREQAKRIQSAQFDMDACVSSGEYERAEIPANITDSQCKMLKAQRFLAEGKINEANNIIHDSFHELKVPAEMQTAFDTLLAVSEVAADKVAHANSVLKYLDEKYKERAAKPEKFNPRRFGG